MYFSAHLIFQTPFLLEGIPNPWGWHKRVCSLVLKKWLQPALNLWGERYINLGRMHSSITRSNCIFLLPRKLINYVLSYVVYWMQLNGDSCTKNMLQCEGTFLIEVFLCCSVCERMQSLRSPKGRTTSRVPTRSARSRESSP